MRNLCVQEAFKLEQITRALDKVLATVYLGFPDLVGPIPGPSSGSGSEASCVPVLYLYSEAMRAKNG